MNTIFECNFGIRNVLADFVNFIKKHKLNIRLSYVDGNDWFAKDIQWRAKLIAAWIEKLSLALHMKNEAKPNGFMQGILRSYFKGVCPGRSDQISTPNYE